MLIWVRKGEQTDEEDCSLVEFVWLICLYSAVGAWDHVCVLWERLGEWFDAVAAWPFEHERTVNTVGGIALAILLGLVLVTQVAIRFGWWGR